MNKDKYLELIKVLEKHNYDYYTLDNPTISDKEYDLLYDKLIDFEEKNPNLILPNSPSLRVGGDVLDKFEKKEHTTKLYSLDKAQNYEEVKKFIKDVSKSTSNKITYSVEQKLDGLSFILRYENGILKEARTRGTGKIGEIVTEQVKTIKSIPLSIDFKDVIEVQGEIFMPLDKFKKYNDKISKEFEEIIKNLSDPSEENIKKLQNKFVTLKNPRNGAAGALRNLDPKVAASRPMDAYLYNVPYIENKKFNSQKEMMDFLKNNKFKVNPYFEIVDNEKDLLDLLEKMKSIRPNLNFDIDGMVIKINEVTTRDILGYTAKFPKWAIAFKFEAIEETTTLVNVFWQVGRTGKLTPIAELEPVDINGATITKATLNNVDDIIRKNVKIGSEVFVRRSNDVIPEIMGVVNEDEGTKILIPTNCPECNSKLVEDGAHLFCKNIDSCPSQLINKIVHFAGREAMNIDTFSEKTASQLWESNLLKSINDLYKLKKEDLVSLERFGERKADNLIEAIENSKKTTLDRFLYGLGIRHVGKGTVERITKYYDNYEEISKLKIDDFLAIEDIGDIVADSLFNFFNDKKSIDSVKELFNLGVEIIKIEKKFDSEILKDKVFVITGTLSNSRKFYEEIIKNNQGIVSSSVTKKTDYLLAGEEAGSKLEKAKKLEVTILNEDEFFNITNKKTI